MRLERMRGNLIYVKSQVGPKGLDFRSIVVIAIDVAWPVEMCGATPKIRVILLNEVPIPPPPFSMKSAF